MKRRFIKPAKHFVKFLAENQADDGKREFLEFHRFPKYSAEDFRRLNISKIAPRNLQFQSDEILRSLECQGSECADVVHRDGLVRFIASNRIGQLSLEDSDFDGIDIIVLHERRRAKHGGW